MPSVGTEKKENSLDMLKDVLYNRGESILDHYYCESKDRGGVNRIMYRKMRIGILIHLSLGIFLLSTACKSGEKKMTITVTNSIIIGDSTLTWERPTTYSNNNPLTVSGYRVYYGTESGTYSGVIDINDKSATNNFTDLFSGASGTYYFAVKAYDSSGVESDYSNEASKFINIP